ncbi:MAG: phosphopantetheine-binding protein [Bacteroidota bacterium]|nr:phosphopantetheine-binding protein [Bacteroidota bacterium]
MTKNGVLVKLTNIFREIFNDREIVINNKTTAQDIDNWDSLTHMLLISKIEEEFEIKFKLKELNNLNNVGNLVEIINEKI